MDDQEKRTYDRLIEKSQEAFILAIELYNRPTIKYHAEGCAFFLCNVWELMLKAYLISLSGNSAIFYPDGMRTLSLSDCLKAVFTNENDPLRKNLEVVCDLRNTSTHFVTDEYELFYGPVLQDCVRFYDIKLKELLGIEISDRIPENYLSLSVRRGDVDFDTIRARYSPEVVKRMIDVGSAVSAARAGTFGSATYSSEFRLTKKVDADFTLRFDASGEKVGTIFKSLTKPVDKYRYRAKTGVAYIRSKLNKDGVTLLCNGEQKEFNSFHFQVFVDFYNMKGNEKYAYNMSLPNETPSYCY